jgi:GDP-L-fucose synthase
MKILVLGGHGFFGKNLVHSLCNTPHQIFAYSRRNGLDLTDYKSTWDCLREIQPDVIYNCAAHVGGLHYVAQYPADILADNLQMSLNLYRAAEVTCPSVLVINPLSNCSYPGHQEVYRESEWLKGEVHPSIYAYGNAKRALYTLSRCYSTQYGIKTYNFLVPNVFGPGDATDPNKVHALNGMIIRMLAAKWNHSSQFEIWGTGTPIREWIYIEDVVNLLTEALTLDVDLRHPINLAQKHGYSIRSSAELIAKAIAYKGKLVFKTEYQDGAPQKIMDDQQFKRVFPSYQFTDHYAAICKTVDYYQSVLSPTITPLLHY